MSTKEGGPASSAPQPEVIDATEDAGIGHLLRVLLLVATAPLPE